MARFLPKLLNVFRPDALRYGCRRWLTTSTIVSSSVVNDYIVRSDSPDVTLKTGNLIGHLLQDLPIWEKQTALTCTITGRDVTFGEFRDQISRWGSYLTNILKLAPGSVVAIVAPNTIEGAALIYGAIGHGYVYTGVNPTYTPDEIASQLSDSGAKVVVVYTLLQDKVEEALAKIPHQPKIISLGPKFDDSNNLPRVEDILNNSAISMIDLANVIGSETIAVMYSSGTTGKPKGVEVSHNAAIANMQMINLPHLYAGHANSPECQQSYLMILPHFHMAGFLAILCHGIMRGIRLYNIPLFEPDSFMNVVLENKIEHLHLVPSLLNFILSRPECKPENFKHVKAVLSGAAPIPVTAIEAVPLKIGGHVSIQHAYGMSEVMLTHLDPVGMAKIGFSGKCLPNVTCKVVDIETGKTLKPTETGEICIKTPGMMKGYLNRPDDTNDIIDSEGFLHSGDVGCFDEEGYVKIIDRTKELIKVNALQVSPSEIEDIILQLPEVVEVSVVGVPHIKTGEAPRAYVVSKSALDPQKVIKYIEGKAAKHKHLTGGVVMVDSLPKNATGKVMRKELVKMALEDK